MQGEVKVDQPAPEQKVGLAVLHCTGGTVSCGDEPDDDAADASCDPQNVGA